MTVSVVPSADGSVIVPVVGSSNQPSIPVRRLERSLRTKPWPIDSHQARSADCSQAVSESSLANR